MYTCVCWRALVDRWQWSVSDTPCPAVAHCLCVPLTPPSSLTHYHSSERKKCFSPESLRWHPPPDINDGSMSTINYSSHNRQYEKLTNPGTNECTDGLHRNSNQTECAPTLQIYIFSQQKNPQTKHYPTSIPWLLCSTRACFDIHHRAKSSLHRRWCLTVVCAYCRGWHTGFSSGRWSWSSLTDVPFHYRNNLSTLHERTASNQTWHKDNSVLWPPTSICLLIRNYILLLFKNSITLKGKNNR